MTAQPKSLIFGAGMLVLAVFSLAGVKEQLEDIQFPSQEERGLKSVAPDADWNKPFYLYSKTGIPYRCYMRTNNGLPLSCRRTTEGEETIEALKNYSPGQSAAKDSPKRRANEKP